MRHRRPVRPVFTALLVLGALSLSASSARAVTLQATLRDFSDEHIDFENKRGDDRGIVRAELGPDRLPVYAGGDGTLTTHGRAAFDQWYRDVDGVNRRRELALPLTDNGDGTYSFESDAFFPLDDELIGNQGRIHNYHFTTEIHARFTYRGGERFDFDGDDDVFVFINGALVIDLGGVHGEESAGVSLDEVADRIGLVRGGVYDLDLFHAERKTTRSNFRLTTTLVLDGGDSGDNGDSGQPGGGEVLQPGSGAGSGDIDLDGDGVPDGDDTDLDGDGVDNGADTDLDGDGVDNAIDTDLDGDGVDNRDDPDSAGVDDEGDSEDDSEDHSGGDSDADASSSCAAGAVSPWAAALLVALGRRRRSQQKR